MGSGTQSPSISDLHAKFCALVASNIIGRCQEPGKPNDGATDILDEFITTEVDVKVLKVYFDRLSLPLIESQ